MCEVLLPLFLLVMTFKMSNYKAKKYRPKKKAHL